MRVKLLGKNISEVISAQSAHEKEKKQDGNKRCNPFHNLCNTPNDFRALKSRKMILAGHIQRTGR
jgi:hypothetical protein